MCGFTLKRVRDMVRIYSQMHLTDKYSQHTSIIRPVLLNFWLFVYEVSGSAFEFRWSGLNFRFRACLKQRVLGIQRTIACRFILNRVRDVIRTYSQMHRTDKYLQNSSIIWPVWLKGLVFVYQLSGSALESCYSYLNFRFRGCFEQGVP